MLLDFASLSVLRADHHFGGNDCLHYCCHSVLDDWLLYMVNALNHTQSIGSRQITDS
jgi:hypothetical protein